MRRLKVQKSNIFICHCKVSRRKSATTKNFFVQIFLSKKKKKSKGDKGLQYCNNGPTDPIPSPHKVYKMPVPIPEYQRDWWCSITLHHLSYTTDTILCGLGTAEDGLWPSPQSRLTVGPSALIHHNPTVVATIGPAGRSRVFFYWVWPAAW